jgi:trehalose-6-phosphatase
MVNMKKRSIMLDYDGTENRLISGPASISILFYYYPIN